MISSGIFSRLLVTAVIVGLPCASLAQGTDLEPKRRFSATSANIPLTPFQLTGSISGRLVDAVDGTPLTGFGPPFAVAILETVSTVVEVETATVYDIALRDSAGPVMSGRLFTYRLTFGYREVTAVPATSIVRFPVPAGTSFVFASNNRLLAGNAAEWNLGSLMPGQVGVRTVVVNVNPTDGEVLEATAEIFNATDATQIKSTEPLTVVDFLPPLGLQIDANADPAQPGKQLNVQLLVINNDVVPRSNVALLPHYPDGVNNTFNGDIYNFLDLQAVKPAVFATPIQPNWIPDADLDNSGSINFADLRIVKSQFFGPPGPSAGGYK